MKITFETKQEKAVVNVEGEKIKFCRDKAEKPKSENQIFVYSKDYVYPEALMDKTSEYGGV